MRSLQGVPFVVLHLCSGHRRQGDFQEHLEALRSSVLAATGRDMLVLSVDVAVDAERGNLASLQVLATWVEHIKARRVGAMLGGPPCETWSRVRGVPIPGRASPPFCAALRNLGAFGV